MQGGSNGSRGLSPPSPLSLTTDDNHTDFTRTTKTDLRAVKVK